MFLEETTNPSHHGGTILTPFFRELIEEEKIYGCLRPIRGIFYLMML
jgi:hypothetical protein